MSSIKSLKNSVINQIAAGEVVEDPSSVIKELVDNSLDAKASKIEIRIKAGGLQYILVADDGIGMVEEDLKKSVLRHATSKIEDLEDLKRIDTMGFRGEALAAIASISRLKITSYKDGRANVLEMEGENSILQESTRERGTSVEVKSLFYNVPARKKFQRSPSSMIREILKILQKIALCHPEVSFILYSEDKKLLDVKGSSFEKRMEEIFFKDILSFSKKIKIQKEGISLNGYIGIPSFVKHNRSYQYIFINKRVVLSNLISNAVKDGYGTRILEKAYPFFIFDLKIDGQMVDVNVHPQKKIVKFSEEKMIYETLREGVSSLFQEKLIKERSFSQPLSFYRETIFSSIDQQKRLVPKEEYVQEEIFSQPFSEIALIDHYYLIFYKKKPMCVDLKAALCRIFYEKIEKKEKIEKQILAVPFTIDVKEDEILWIESKKEELLFMFDLRVIGKNTIIIEAVPHFFEGENILEFFYDILHKKQNMQRKMIRKICSMKKKDFSSVEAKNIVQLLLQCKEPMYDPFGSATMVFLDFEKIFKKGKICLTSKE